jgi:bacterioferritin-associated ferredoxin
VCTSRSVHEHDCLCESVHAYGVRVHVAIRAHTLTHLLEKFGVAKQCEASIGIRSRKFVEEVLCGSCGRGSCARCFVSRRNSGLWHGSEMMR